MHLNLSPEIRRIALLFVSLALALIPVPEAWAAGQGPGPFANVRVTPSGLLLTLRGSSSSFTGEPRLDVSDGGPWVACDRRGVVKSGGTQLLQKGTVGGVDIGEYFPQDESRRIRIRNGDGGATELDVVRTGDGFLISWTNRTPSKAKRLALSEATIIDALADRSVTVRPPSSAEPVFDIVAVVTNAPSPQDANDQSVSLLATNVATGATSSQNTTYGGDGRVTFHHMLLPAGTYRFEAFRSVSYGNPLTFLSSLSERIAFDGQFTVGRDARTVALAVPDDPLPLAVASTIVVDGVGVLSPSVANRVTVGLRLTQVNGPATLFADRSVTNSDPIPFDVQIPPGDYTVQISAGSQVDGSSRTSTSISLGEVRVADNVRLEIPALVRFTGSILDPDFQLFTDGSFPGDVSQRVFIGSTVNSTPPYSALSSLFGFSRSYQASLPVGGSVLVSASLAVDVGGPGTAGTPFGRLDFQVTPEPVPIEGNVDVDIPVPGLPEAVTISGTAVDRAGKSVANAFVYVQGSNVDGLPGATYTTSATTNKNGQFTVRVLRGRSYAIRTISGFGIEF